MANSAFLVITIVIQALTFGILTYFGFELDTSQMINIFVSSVWGSVFSLGACIIYLSHHSKKLKDESRESEQITNKKVLAVSLWMLICCMVFVLLSSIYPAKIFIKKVLPSLETHKALIKLIYDSLLFSLFIWPCIAAIVVGAWVLTIEYENRHKS